MERRRSFLVGQLAVKPERRILEALCVTHQGIAIAAKADPGSHITGLSSTCTQARCLIEGANGSLSMGELRLFCSPSPGA
jgi:hypothetical protein